MHLIINKKKIQILEAKSFFRKLLGLMWKKNFKYGMLFKKTNSIHTFFMKEIIDVIGLDENNIVIYKRPSMKKCSVAIVNYPIKKTSILELPNNTSQSINIGDKLTFISE